MKPTLKFKPPYNGFLEDVEKGLLISGTEFCFLAPGLALVTLGILFMAGINPLHGSGSGWGLIIAGGYFGAIPGLRIGSRLLIRRLIPADKLYDRLHLDYVALHKVMQEKSVQPRLTIGDLRFYSRSDFGDVSSLLRASVAPQAATETLLRSASGTTQQPSSQHLLHSVTEDPVPPTPAVNTTVIPEQPQNIQTRD